MPEPISDEDLDQWRVWVGQARAIQQANNEEAPLTDLLESLIARIDEAERVRDCETIRADHWKDTALAAEAERDRWKLHAEIFAEQSQKFLDELVKPGRYGNFTGE